MALKQDGFLWRGFTSPSGPFQQTRHDTSCIRKLSQSVKFAVIEEKDIFLAGTKG